MQTNNRRYEPIDLADYCCNPSRDSAILPTFSKHLHQQPTASWGAQTRNRLIGILLFFTTILEVVGFAGVKSKLAHHQMVLLWCAIPNPKLRNPVLMNLDPENGVTYVNDSMHATLLLTNKILQSTTPTHQLSPPLESSPCWQLGPRRSVSFLVYSSMCTAFSSVFGIG